MGFKTTYTNGKEANLKIRSAQDKNKTTYLFPAFLTSFTNSFSSNWSEEQVYGRIDPIGTFQGTKRTINIGFDIIAYDIAEARSNILAIDAVTQMLYPSYNDVGLVSGESGKNGNALILSKSPLVEIKFANLIHDFGSGDDGFLLGWITSWSANPVLDMGMFTPNAGEFLPKVYNATLDFTPQHRGDLAFNSENAAKAKFPYDGGS
jgi:hypothetical protein